MTNARVTLPEIASYIQNRNFTEASRYISPLNFNKIFAYEGDFSKILNNVFDPRVIFDVLKSDEKKAEYDDLIKAIFRVLDELAEDDRSDAFNHLYFYNLREPLVKLLNGGVDKISKMMAEAYQEKNNFNATTIINDIKKIEESSFNNAEMGPQSFDEWREEAIGKWHEALKEFQDKIKETSLQVEDERSKRSEHVNSLISDIKVGYNEPKAPEKIESHKPSQHSGTSAKSSAPGGSAESSGNSDAHNPLLAKEDFHKLSYKEYIKSDEELEHESIFALLLYLNMKSSKFSTSDAMKWVADSFYILAFTHQAGISQEAIFETAFANIASDAFHIYESNQYTKIVSIQYSNIQSLKYDKNKAYSEHILQDKGLLLFLNTGGHHVLLYFPKGSEKVFIADSNKNISAVKNNQSFQHIMKIMFGDGSHDDKIKDISVYQQAGQTCGHAAALNAAQIIQTVRNYEIVDEKYKLIPYTKSEYKELAEGFNKYISDNNGKADGFAIKLIADAIVVNQPLDHFKINDELHNAQLHYSNADDRPVNKLLDESEIRQFFKAAEFDNAVSNALLYNIHPANPYNDNTLEYVIRENKGAENSMKNYENPKDLLKFLVNKVANYAEERYLKTLFEYIYNDDYAVLKVLKKDLKTKLEGTYEKIEELWYNAEHDENPKVIVSQDDDTAKILQFYKDNMEIFFPIFSQILKNKGL